VKRERNEKEKEEKKIYHDFLLFKSLLLNQLLFWGRHTPSSFQATMNRLFQPYLRRYIIVFFDDILVYIRSFSDHLRHLEIAFQVLKEGEFTLKFSKCSFA